jgi:tetratricopeptide (TPR) repeat protein
MGFISRLFGKKGKQKTTTPSSRQSTKINLFVGGTPPPGALVFKADGTIERTADSPQARHEWTVQKMTLKIEREPYDGEWYFERGTSLMALGRYAQAVIDFCKLVDFYPDYHECYRLRGICYYHANDHARALADLRRYRELCDVNLETDAIKILAELEDG